MFKDERGTTLIELLIVIAIMGIVFTMVAPFFKVSEVVFKEGQDQTVEQHAVRLTVNILTKKIRNATTIDLFANSTGLSGFDEYYYIKDNQLIRYDGSDETVVTQADLADFPSGLEFNIVGSADVYFLEYTVVGVGGYETTSKVLLNNIDDDKMTGVTTSGEVVGISKP